MNQPVHPEEAICQRCGYLLSGLERSGLCPECGKHFDCDHPSTYDTSRTKAGKRLAIASLAISVFCLLGVIPMLIWFIALRQEGNAWPWLIYLGFMGTCILAVRLAAQARQKLTDASRSTYREVAKLGMVIGFACLGLLSFLCVVWTLLRFMVSPWLE